MLKEVKVNVMQTVTVSMAGVREEAGRDRSLSTLFFIIVMAPSN